MKTFIKIALAVHTFVASQPVEASRACRDALNGALLQGEADRGGFIDFLREESGIARIQQIMSGQSGLTLSSETAEGVAFLGERLGESFRVFAFHPGILARKQGFVEYVEANDFKSAPLDHIYESFQSHLGKAKLHRAIVLSKDEVPQISAEGFLSSFLRRSGRSEFDSYTKIAKEGLSALISAHVDMANLPSSPLMSFSEAKVVSQRVTRPDKEAGRLRYVFEVEVNVLDIYWVDLHRSTGVAIEVLVGSNITPFQIKNLYSVRPESFFVSIHDMVEEFRYSLRSSLSLKLDDNYQAESGAVIF